MKLLLLAGGSGKRLWPLSNQVRSKPFLKLVKNEEGHYESMLQRICRQLDTVGLFPSTYIVTCQHQIELVRNQIGNEVKVIIEPQQRGTFPSLSLACTYLHSILQIKPDEIIGVLPVDALADIDFFHVLKQIPFVIHKSQANLALIGVTPQSPSDQFGYIVPKKDDEKDYYPICHFTEKPSAAQAKNLIKKNALWNCGVFIFPLEFMLSLLVSKGLPTSHRKMLEIYERLPVSSFDVEVAEKTSQSIVIPYSGKWRDVGSWEAIAEQLDNPILGQGRLSEDCVGTHIINQLSIPINVIGISNSIIAAGPDGILIADKKKSSAIKQMVKNQSPITSDERWGSYRVLHEWTTKEGMESQTRIYKIKKGAHMSYHTHFLRQEIWTVISGTGEILLNGEITEIKPGDVLKIPAGAKHAVKASTPLEIMGVLLGTKIDEADVVCHTVSWKEALEGGVS